MINDILAYFGSEDRPIESLEILCEYSTASINGIDGSVLEEKDCSMASQIMRNLKRATYKAKSNVKKSEIDTAKLAEVIASYGRRQ